MSKITKAIRASYVFLILGIFYVPIIFASVFSFNAQAKKGDLSFTHLNLDTHSWKELGSVDNTNAMLNSIIMGIFVALIVAVIGLLTTFGLWKQRNKAYRIAVDSSANIPLINPDVITAVGLSIVFGVMFGTLTIDHDGMWRAIISHVTMILPFGLTLMLPRSDKFHRSMIEASKDLGFGPIRTWFNTYFRHMLPITLVTMVVSLTLSFDDFILTRTTSNVTTIGTKLYEGSFKGWALALGAILFALTTSVALGYTFFKNRKRGKHA